MKKILCLMVSLIVSNIAMAEPQGVVDRGPGMWEIEQMAIGCKTMLVQKDFKKLEEHLLKIDNTPEGLNKSGVRKIPFCMAGITTAPNKDSLIKEWNTNSPNNIYARIAAQYDVVEDFFKYRGDKYISQTDPNDLKKAFKVLNDGGNEMDKAKSLGDSPFWYQKRLGIAFFQNPELFMKILKEATTKYPDYENIYQAAVKRMMPQWGFSYETVNNFALYAVKNSSKKEDMYAFVYAAAVTPCCSSKILAEKKFDKELFRKGVYSILKKYPTDYNYNLFARTACLLEDKKTALDLIHNKIELVEQKMWEEGLIMECAPPLK